MRDHEESSDLLGQRQLRIEKLNELKKLKISPYPSNSRKDRNIKDILENFESLEGQSAIVAGRIKNIRSHGKLKFIDLMDDSGLVQIYIKVDEIKVTELADTRSLSFDELSLLDSGDFIEVLGQVTKTNTGAISVLAHEVVLLTKILRPLPTALEDKEERFRRRYVDMNVNPEVKERMKRRALFWDAHREFFREKDFYEVNIPVLEDIPGGGDAVPFITHMNAINQDFFLRISHELPLKRLIGAGFEKVFDIGARFRNEGLSDEHLPEHVAMEFYWAYADWKDGMKFIQDLFMHVIKTVYGDSKVFKIREFEVDFSKDWEIMDFNEIFQKTYGVKDIYTITIEEVKELLTKHSIQFDRSVNIPRGVDALWKKIRKNVQGPTFLVNHPKYLSPLQKPSPENPNMVERFQIIIAGSELGNGWSEVNDPIDQYERFLEQQKLRDLGDEEAQWLDIDYVEMLEYGMPPTFGWGHSERVFWFLENVTAKEGVPFPQLKFSYDELTKKIYKELNFDELEENRTKGLTPSTSSDKVAVEKSASTSNLLSREDALKLLEEWVAEPYQILHAKMVAAGLEMYAEKYGEDKDLWYITGLLHDLDYHKHPDEHPAVSVKYFEEKGFSNELIHAVAAHAWMRTGIKPESQLAKALVATDEMSGLIYAYSLVRGADKFKGMEVKSVLKRFKESKFAAKINREEIQYGVDLMGISLDEHISNLISVFESFQY